MLVLGQWNEDQVNDIKKTATKEESKILTRSKVQVNTEFQVAFLV
jgi:hypothetical protein